VKKITELLLFVVPVCQTIFFLFSLIFLVVIDIAPLVYINAHESFSFFFNKIMAAEHRRVPCEIIEHRSLILYNYIKLGLICQKGVLHNKFIHSTRFIILYTVKFIRDTNVHDLITQHK
jgi:hypothetical protein